jgi:hypothetical protein
LLAGGIDGAVGGDVACARPLAVINTTDHGNHHNAEGTGARNITANRAINAARQQSNTPFNKHTIQQHNKPTAPTCDHATKHAPTHKHTHKHTQPHGHRINQPVDCMRG